MKKRLGSIVIGEEGSRLPIRPASSDPNGTVQGNAGEVVYEAGTGKRWISGGGTTWSHEPEGYTAASPSHWAGSPPSSVDAAADRLMAAFNELQIDGLPSMAPTALRAGSEWAPLILAPGASVESSSAAGLLAQWLERVSSPGPLIATYSGPSGPGGIRIGTRDEWIGIDGSIPSWGSSWDYANKKIGGQFYVLGRTSRGLGAAIARLANAIGIWRLTPTLEWEIRPTVGASLVFPADQGPLAMVFRLFQGLGNLLMLDGDMTTRYGDWAAENGLLTDGKWQYGHAYLAIISANQAQFNLHPEYVGGGVGAKGNKLCVREDGVKAAALTRALSLATSDRRAVSMAAADGTVGWSSACIGTHEEQTDSPSTRQALLALSVADGLVSAGHADIFVSLLAYADCSAAPNVTLDSRIFVVWATAFMAGGLSAEQVRDGYLAAGAIHHAPYSYPSEWLWDQDRQGIARATQRSEVVLEAERISSGAIGWAGESSSAWGPCGRWYWALAGTMFGEDAGARWDAWPALAFPSATSAATAWALIAETRVPMSSDLIHRFSQASLDLIDAVEGGGGSSDEIERALDLARWVVYLGLLKTYDTTTVGSNTARDALEPVMQWSYRIRNRDLVAYTGQYDLPNWDTDRKLIAAKYGRADLSSTSSVWADTPTTESEIRAKLAAAISANPTIPFQPVGYSLDLVRVAGLTHASTVRGNFVEQTRDYTFFYHAAGKDIFTFKAGLINNGKGPAHVKIYEYASREVVWEYDIPADNTLYSTQPGAPPPGANSLPEVLTKAQVLYAIEVTKTGTAIKWTWPVGTGVDWVTSGDVPIFTGTFSFYFYVPLGTKTVGFFAQSGSIKFLSPIDNTQIGSTIAASNNYYTVSVPDGLDGKCWKMTGASNRFQLMTVPPEVAFSPTELLLPREVVETDGLELADATPAPVRPYTKISYSTDLAHPTSTLTGTGSRGFTNYAGHAGILGYLSAQGASTTLHVTGGIVKLGVASVITVTDLTASGTQTINVTNTDGVTSQDYSVTTINGHLYKIELTTLGGSIRIDWDTGVRISMIGLGQDTLSTPWVASVGGWLYVPKGTTSVGFYADGGSAKFYDNHNKLITTISCSRGFYQFPVPAGKAGTCMRFSGLSGRFAFETVPPEWSFAPGELLLPSQVIADDGI